MNSHGSLKELKVPEIIKQLGMQKKTGILKISGENRSASVSFLNGNIISATETGSDIDARIGKIMVKSGLIAENDLTFALAQQKKTEKKLWNVLVEDKTIDIEILKEILKVQTVQVIDSLFYLKDGEYSFDSDAAVKLDKDSFLPIPMGRVLMKGSRIINEWPEISKKILSFEIVFKLKGELTDVVEFSSRLTAEERRVYHQVNDRNTVQEIIYRTRLPAFDVCRTLYKLLRNEAIEGDKNNEKKPSFNVDFVNPFLEGTIDVFETMVGVQVNAGKPYLKKMYNLARGDISGIIGLTGDKKGTFSLSFSKRCILKVVSNVLDVQVNYIDIQVRDMVGELTNIIGGNGRGKLSEKGYNLQASVPTTIVGEHHYIEHGAGVPCIVIPFTTVIGPFTAEVSLEK